MPRTASPPFPSGLLDETEPVTPRSALWLRRFTIILVLITVALGILLGEVWWLNASTASDYALHGATSASWSLSPPATVARPTGPYQGLCDGSEVFCLSAESSQPAETLRQLAAALSVEPTQRYQLHLTITSLEQETTPASEAPPPAVPPAATAP